MAKQKSKSGGGSQPKAREGGGAGGAGVGLKGLLAHPQVLVLKAIVLLLVTYSLMRVLFLAYNAGGGWDFEWSDVPLALLVGLRFDIATIVIFQGLPLLLLALPVWQARGRRVLLWILMFTHLVVVFLNATDVVYFGFAAKRLSHEFFSGGKEAGNFDWRDIQPYWWLLLVIVLVVVGQLWMLLRAERKVKAPSGGGLARVWGWAMPVLFAGLLFLGFRGGFQTRPLRPANAFVTSSAFLANVSLNSAYTVAQSVEIGNEPGVDLLPPEEALSRARDLVRNDFDGAFDNPEYPLLRSTQFSEPERRYNVVILIVESLNAAKVGWVKGKPPGESLTPYLDSLSRHARCYPHFFSNGARSVQSLPAILNSTPDIFDRPLIGSSFETHPQWGIGSMLQKRGYHTSFVCGGPNGTMGFDSYSHASGLAHYYGASDYAGHEGAPASNWGMHDEVTLKWLQELQGSFPKPFLNVWFSISNHFPFDLPTDCPEEISKKAISAMDKTVAYTDWALGHYFDWALRQSWADSTIFVLTGDHCFYYEGDPDRGDVQNYHVPLMLIGPGIEPGMDARVGSHISILPTLIELLRLRTRWSGAGVSMLSKSNEPYGITGVMGLQSLVRKDIYLGSTFDQIVYGYRLGEGQWTREDSLRTSTEGKGMEQSLKAIYQVCSDIRRGNRQNLPKGME